MKNLVKKTHKKSWIIIPAAFLILFFVSYCIFMSFFVYVSNLTKTEIETSMIILMMLCSLSVATSISIMINERIYKSVNRQILSNKECRNIHHTNLIKKYILLNDKEKSEKLLNQYKNAKYKNNKMLYYFYGAYQRQFDNLNYSPLINFSEKDCLCKG